ncbi:uncharacterized protein EI97DRAFT_184294 [Westerdykella ornata]|uniref:Uncharacterized protein n=1 Tax=Westerdykella ornata TaxID=318751 RepID=A0A6A6JSW8_WESOR|nr:uncharacterized protein EI97DRAFT_184294 [Westerdykella ornata]KAF2279700.1 hypothetical protein EI97DRAFT_184294 [Westerdykella ornata]
MPSLLISTITLSAFQKILSRYPASVPETLRELDDARYETIPATLAKRREEVEGKGEVGLRKDEVLRLVEWKLKHGTFRSKLLQLVQSNPAAQIEQTTKDAFSLFTDAKKDAAPGPDLDPDPDPDPKAILAALKILTGLRGIGPATASLLLSVYAPGKVPFFSDELFRWAMWAMWAEAGTGTGKAQGWKRVIKYNVREYEALVAGVGELRGRLGVSAVEAEKVAWVLGREGVDVGGDFGDEGRDLGTRDGGEERREGGDVELEGKEEDVRARGGDGGGRVGKRKAEETKAAGLIGVKRKKREAESGKARADASPQGLRRSSRRKTDK